jgi:hypothetical protein
LIHVDFVTREATHLPENKKWPVEHCSYNVGNISLVEPRIPLQQGAEKYLKAFIVPHDLEFRRAHDLGLLLKICSAHDPSFEGLREDCKEYRHCWYEQGKSVYESLQVAVQAHPYYWTTCLPSPWNV